MIEGFANIGSARTSLGVVIDGALSLTSGQTALNEMLPSPVGSPAIGYCKVYKGLHTECVYCCTREETAVHISCDYDELVEYSRKDLGDYFTTVMEICHISSSDVQWRTEQ